MNRAAYVVLTALLATLCARVFTDGSVPSGTYERVHAFAHPPGVVTIARTGIPIGTYSCAIWAPGAADRCLSPRSMLTSALPSTCSRSDDTSRSRGSWMSYFGARSQTMSDPQSTSGRGSTPDRSLCPLERHSKGHLMDASTARHWHHDRAARFAEAARAEKARINLDSMRRERIEITGEDPPLGDHALYVRPLRRAQASLRRALKAPSSAPTVAPALVRRTVRRAPRRARVARVTHTTAGPPSGDAPSPPRRSILTAPRRAPLEVSR